MSRDRAGSQCGLTTLLPMSCRGRAAAFARDLHSRLRSLGATQDSECENSWLTRAQSTHRPPSSPHSQRELETFYDFDLECGSPSSPVENEEPSFPDKQNEDTDPPFYDVEPNSEHKEHSKLLLKQPDAGKNGFTFSTAFYTESPIKIQPTSRENGHADKPLYSAITFEGCARQNSYDEVDCAIQTTLKETPDRLSFPEVSSALDSDAECELAKSDPCGITKHEILKENNLDSHATDVVGNVTLTNGDTLNEVEEILTVSVDNNVSGLNESIPIKNNLAEKRTNEVYIENELSSAPGIASSVLKLDSKIEEDLEDDKPQRVRRCSSLKTGKTPPGTPGRKKIVRFADVLGLDLADVKTFLDEIPVIPKSAYDDLTGCDVQSSPPTRPAPRQGSLTLVPLFQLPKDFTEKLEKQNVCLESSRVCDGVHVTICGSVRVRNLDFHKTVHIRYSMNRWKTYTDLQATYVQGSCDGYSDRFQFLLYVPCITSGQRLEIAVRFQCKGQQFWDNNSGANYCFDCLALGATTLGPSPPAMLHPTVDWHPSFY